MHSLQKALEFYKKESGSYPGEIVFEDDGTITSGGVWDEDINGNQGLSNIFNSLIAEELIQVAPHAPYFPNNKTSYFLGYSTYPTAWLQEKYGESYICGDQPISKYVIYMYSNTQGLPLQRLMKTTDHILYYDFFTNQNVTASTTGPGTYCLSI